MTCYIFRKMYIFYPNVFKEIDLEPNMSQNTQKSQILRFHIKCQTMSFRGIRRHQLIIIIILYWSNAQCIIIYTWVKIKYKKACSDIRIKWCHSVGGHLPHIRQEDPAQF